MKSGNTPPTRTSTFEYSLILLQSHNIIGPSQLDRALTQRSNILLISGRIQTRHGKSHAHCSRVHRTNENQTQEVLLSAVQIVHTDPRQHHEDLCLLGRLVLLSQQHSCSAVGSKQEAVGGTACNTTSVQNTIWTGNTWKWQAQAYR